MIDNARKTRLAEIRGRDLERLSEKHISKCLHLDFRIGPIKFYFNPLTSIAAGKIIWAFVINCIMAKDYDAERHFRFARSWITVRARGCL